MTEISEEAQGLGEIMGKYSAAAFLGISNTLAVMVSRGAIRPNQARAILLSLGETAGGPEMLAAMKLHAARLMSQRPLKRRGR